MCQLENKIVAVGEPSYRLKLLNIFGTPFLVHNNTMSMCFGRKMVVFRCLSKFTGLQVIVFSARGEVESKGCVKVWKIPSGNELN